jgi:hypothetical protein
MTSKIITPETPLLVPPLLASEIGLESAMILQQIHYFCQRSKHLLDDGRRWFYLTLDGWSQQLPFLKPSAIRRAIANLRQLELIDVCRHSRGTWYQSNWFTINAEKVKVLWDRICQHKQIDLSILDTSSCSEPADHIKDFSTRDFPTRDFPTQQHAVAPEKVVVEEKTKETKIEEQVQTTHSVDELEEVNSTNESESDGGSFSAAVEPVEKTSQPSQEEVQQVLQQLREISCTPQFRLNSEIQRTVKRYWDNVPGAIAYLKEALRIWKGIKSPEAVFVAACKEGRKPEVTQVVSDTIAWFEWARKERIVLALSGGVVYTPSGEAVEMREMMRRYPIL